MISIDFPKFVTYHQLFVHDEIVLVGLMRFCNLEHLHPHLTCGQVLLLYVEDMVLCSVS